MDEMFKEMLENLPKDLLKERKLPDGSTRREFGPFVYGYSLKIGPDGKPEIREFGNVKPSLAGPKVKEEREPLVDIVETNGEIHVVAELPGVEKQDIDLHGTEDSLTISVNTEEHKYYKELKLPGKVRIKEATSTYKNGVLQVILPRIGQSKPKGESINIS